MNNSYRDFRAILERVKTYKRLIFYHREVADPYILAAFGFKFLEENEQNRKGQKMAKCEYCRSIIKFDNLMSQFVDSKQPLKYALRNHHSECKFYDIKSKGLPLQINIKTINEYGLKLYEQILESYKGQKIEEAFRKLKIDFGSLQQKLTIRQKQAINYFWSSKYTDKKIQTLALLGWTLQETDAEDDKEKFILECQYCGEKCILNEESSFNCIGNHLPSCGMMLKDLWKIVLNLLIIRELDGTEGEFLKTESMKLAKELRQQLKRIYESKGEFLQKMKKQIQEMRRQRRQRKVEEQDKQIEESLGRFSAIGSELQREFETITKRLKFQ